MNDTIPATAAVTPLCRLFPWALVVRPLTDRKIPTMPPGHFDFRLTTRNIVVVRSWNADAVAPRMAPCTTGAVSSFDDRTVRKMLVADTAVAASRYPGHPACSRPLLLQRNCSPSWPLPRTDAGRRYASEEFAGLLLGSVSSHCVQLATCPVLVGSEEH
jgi:hypothetical protein